VNAERAGRWLNASCYGVWPTDESKMEDNKNSNTTGLLFCFTGHQPPTWVRRIALGWLIDLEKLPMYNLAR